MTTRLTRERIERLYPDLPNFFGAYLHEDWMIDHASPQDAIEAAFDEYPSDLRKRIHAQLVALRSKIEDDVDARRVLAKCLGVNVSFPKAKGARDFLDHIEGRLTASLKGELQR